MIFRIRASCKDCDFSGTSRQVFEHCKETKHGRFGDEFWGSDPSSRNRCNMNPNKEDLIKAILKASVSDIAERVCQHRDIYTNFLDEMLDEGACDKLPYEIEADDIDDVVVSYPAEKLKKKITEYLKNIDSVLVNV